MKKTTIYFIFAAFAMMFLALTSATYASDGVENMEEGFYSGKTAGTPQDDPLGEKANISDNEQLKAPNDKDEAEKDGSGDESSARNEITGAAKTVEWATDLTSLCGFAPGAGIAAIPCIAVQSVNFLAKGIGLLFGK